MLMFWKYKEVFVGYSMQEFNRIRDILKANNIKDDYRIVNLGSNSRARCGAYGENPEYARMYYVYVHKSDYEQACALIL